MSAPDAATILDIALRNVTVANASDNGCQVSGTLNIKLPGNDVSTAFNGNVDAYDKLYSTTINPFSVNIAGFAFTTRQPRLAEQSIALGDPTITAPAALGGGSIPVLASARIDQNGLQIVPSSLVGIAANKLALPGLKLANGGFGFGDLTAEVKSEANGYRLAASGSFIIPGLNSTAKAPAGSDSACSDAQQKECGISAEFAIFVNAQGNLVIQIASDSYAEPMLLGSAADVMPQDTNATEGCLFGNVCLSTVGVGLNAEPGINLDQGYAGGSIWLTGVRGSITLTSHDTRISIGMTIATSTIQLPVLGPLLSATGDAELQILPEFGVALKAAMKMFVLNVADGEVSYYASKGFRARLSATDPSRGFLRYEGEIRIWGSGQSGYLYANGPWYAAGSGSVGWYINEGEIYKACTDVPCGIRYCTGWYWWWWSWRSFQYPCGLDWCYRCLNVPPSRIWLAGGTGDIGHFKGDVWGIKGQVNFLIYSTGVFYDLVNNRVTWGNVNGYVLDGPTVLQALAAWQAATPDERMSSLQSGASVVVDAPDTQTLVLRTPTGLQTKTPAQLSTMRNALAANGKTAAALDIITTTNVITQSDTIFSISAVKPVSISLLLPANVTPPAGLGREITTENYAAYAPDFRIAYQQSVTYTAPVSTPQARWRYMSATIMPLTVTVNLDGKQVVEDIVLSPGYRTVAEGSHTVAIAPETGTGIEVPLQVVTNTDTTILTFMDGANLAAFLLTDDRTMPTGLQHGRVRFVNLITDRSDALDLYLNGQRRIQGINARQVSDGIELPAGSYQAEIKTAAGVVIASSPLELQSGDHHSLIATAQTMDDRGTPLRLTMLRDQTDVVLTPATQNDFMVDQAPIGEWQVKLIGDIKDAGWSLAVLNATNPPIISDLTVNAADLSAVQVSLRLQSDYSPAKLSIYIAPDVITSTETITNPDDTVDTSVIPQFHGQLVTEVDLTETALLNGSKPIEGELDLSFLESGTYYLWVQVEDGVNSAVNQYASFAGSQRSYGSRSLRVADADFRVTDQYADAGAIQVDHTSTFAGHFQTTVITTQVQIEMYNWDNTLCPDPSADPECEQIDDEWGKWVFEDSYPLYMEWTPSDHPDSDGYIVEITPTSGAAINATQTYTVGDTVYDMYDDNNQYMGVVGYFGWRDASPNTSYRIRIGAVDEESDQISWAAAKNITVPLGSVALAGQPTPVTITPGGMSTAIVTVTMGENNFYPAELVMDLENLPDGLDADYVTAAGRSLESATLSPQGRMAPKAAPATGQNRSMSVARVVEDGSPSAAALDSDFSEAVAVEIYAGSNVAPGVYNVPFVVYSGPLQAETTLQVIVGDGGDQGQNLYLPAIKR